MVDDWDDLRVFLALSRAGNLTRAARDLKVSHPTVARRLRSLEEAIGARLFERLPDRFVLTPAGEELLADAEAGTDGLSVDGLLAAAAGVENP